MTKTPSRQYHRLLVADLNGISAEVITGTKQKDTTVTYRCVFIAHNPYSGGIVNLHPAEPNAIDVEHAKIAHNTVKASLSKLADQDYVGYWWDDRIWAVRRVLTAEPAGYAHIENDYVRLITTKVGMSLTIRDELLAYRGPWFGSRNPVRYGYVDEAGAITLD